MIATEVIRSIEDAWHGVPYPGDDNIFTPDSYDDEDIINYFRRTTWCGHDPVRLREHSSAFTFFSPQAFHFWLPAFLIAAIQNPAEADVIVDHIPWSVSDVSAAQRWRLFSEAQRRAVADYFRFQIASHPDEAADERKALGVLEGAT